MHLTDITEVNVCNQWKTLLLDTNALSKYFAIA